MNYANALVILGFSFPGDRVGSVDIYADDVRRQYAKRVKEAHPDTRDFMFKHDNTVPTIAQLQEARDLLLEALESQKCACKLCRGVGQVRSGMGWRSCSACDGTGETR